MKRLLFFCRALMLTVVLIGLATPSLFAQSQLSNGKGDLRVMTYNVDEGTDYIEVMAATTREQFLVAVGQTITQVRATDPRGRMKAVAKQIIAAAPTFVSLQELDQWFTGSLNLSTGKCENVTLEFDMLQDLINALAEQGAHYTIARQAQQWIIPPVPGLILPSSYVCVGVIDNIAMLARTDLRKFQWSNAQSQQYVNMLLFTTPLGVIPFPRAWIFVDANFNGKQFRVLGTHLESADSTIRRKQGEELRIGPADTSLPVIVAMDSNAQAFPLPQDPTYLDFLLAGYQDVWTEIFPDLPGFTSGQAQLLDNVESQLNTRIDLILTFGTVQAQNIALFGATQSSKTPEGLWPSDHAGVAAQLNVEKHE
jgi:endonuclease/exonuclease/phosphatase family metal-dependent hydrolase